MKQIIIFSVNLLLTLLFFSSSSVYAAEDSQDNLVALDRIVAVVNDEVIAYSTLTQEVKIFLAELRRQNPDVRLPPLSVLVKQVLERMILQRLQLQLAQRTGIRADDTDVNTALREIARENQLSLAQLREIIERDGMDFEEFRDNLRQDMILQRLRQRQVVNRVNVTEREVEEFLSNQAQQGNINEEYHLFHILIAVPEAASPETIAEQKHKAEQVLEKLRAGADFRATALEVSDSRQALEGGDLGWRPSGEVPSLFAQSLRTMQVGEIAGPFSNSSGFHLIKLAEKRSGERNLVTQVHVRHILIKIGNGLSEDEALVQAQNLRERIVEGDDFANLAAAHSDDSSSSANGGDLGWINPGTALVPEFEEAMNKLPPNVLSEPVRSRFGWHLIEVLGRRTHDNSNEALRNQAMQHLRERKVEEQLQTWLRQLREESYVEYRLEE